MTSTAEPLRFTGSGSEYFRIWIVNVLLTIVTLGFYSPWAKVRRLKYFYGNTYLLDAPFDFHGRPLPILAGRVIAIGFLFVYSNPHIFTWQLSAATAVAIALLLPLLMQRSLRFRLRNTSWRNLRFGFGGSAPQAYRALWQPIVVALGLGLILMVAVWALGSNATDALGSGAWGLGRNGDGLSGSVLKLILGAALLVVLLVIAAPLMMAAVYSAWRRFAGNHASFGSARFALQLRLVDVAKIQFVAVLLTGLMLACMIGLVLASIAIPASPEAIGRGKPPLWASIGPLIFVPVFYLGMWSISGYVASRLQRLVWNATTMEQHGFTCDLQARRFMGLMVKNLLLTILTLGLYRPFAAVAKARMQLESVHFVPEGSIDEIVAKAEADQRAIGEEFVDALDFDLSF